MRHPKVIIGQTDSLLSQKLDLLVASGDYEIHISDRGDRVLEMVRLGNPPDLLILENTLLGPDVVEICAQMKRDPELMRVPILLVDPSGSQSEEMFIQAGCDD